MQNPPDELMLCYVPQDKVVACMHVGGERVMLVGAFTALGEVLRRGEEETVGLRNER